MHVYSFLKTRYLFKSIALTALFFSTVQTSAFAASPLCTQLHKDLAQVSGPLALTQSQARRYYALTDAYQRAGADSRIMRCNTSVIIDADAIQKCDYISQSIQSIGREIKRIERKSPNSNRQRRQLQKIHALLRQNQCAPANQQRLLMIIDPSNSAKNNKQPAARHQQGKNQALSRQAAKDNVTPDLTRISLDPAEQIRTQPSALKHEVFKPVDDHAQQLAIISRNGLKMLKSKTANHSSPSLIPDQEPQSFAADQEPAPFIAEQFDLMPDYVPDANIRRVGPAYFPAQKAAKDRQAQGPN